MDNNKTANRTISNIVRKLLKSRNVSIKKAASYVNCTEQSFRNKLSRDSFSIKDLIILCYICDAKLMIDYCAYSDDYDMDFFELSDYLTQEDLERIEKLEKQYLKEDFVKWTMALTNTLTEEDLKNMSNEELGELVKKQFHGKVALINDNTNNTD